MASAARLFLATDGSWGDADGLIVVDVTPEQLEEVDQLNENGAREFLEALPAILVVKGASS